jgi:hypothetical protein
MDKESNNVGVFKVPSDLYFMESSVEVMRMSRDGIWVNPDLSVDETVKAVLNALDWHVKVLVQKAVEDEREACAQTVASIAGDEQYRWAALAIRERGAP